MNITSIWFFILSLITLNSLAQEIKSLDLPSGEETEIRVFKAIPTYNTLSHNKLLLGFPCDTGKSKSEEATAKSLAGDGIEVWMTDMLGTYMLSKSVSSYEKMPKNDLIYILKQAQKTHKDIYLTASGSDSRLLLEVVKRWNAQYPNDTSIKGIVLLFPRLNASKPVPGMPPKYVDAVGKTTTPIFIIEGGRTPNRWGLNHLSAALQKGGSPVISKVIPDIRGYFFNRSNPNRAENIVTSQLSGLMKVGLFYLENTKI